MEKYGQGKIKNCENYSFNKPYLLFERQKRTNPLANHGWPKEKIKIDYQLSISREAVGAEAWGDLNYIPRLEGDLFHLE